MPNPKKTIHEAREEAERLHSKMTPKIKADINNMKVHEKQRIAQEKRTEANLSKSRIEVHNATLGVSAKTSRSNLFATVNKNPDIDSESLMHARKRTTKATTASPTRKHITVHTPVKRNR